MESIIISFKAPFFSYREFNTGDYCYSLPVIPHSAAYGLVLNLAGIEIKGVNCENINTPMLEIAVGLVSYDNVSCLIHQYHKYTQSYGNKYSPYEWVKNDDGTYTLKEEIKKKGKQKTSLSDVKKQYHGRKWGIGIIKREYLIDYHGVIGVKGDSEIINKIKEGIDNCVGSIPYAGQSNLMFSHLNIENTEAYWLVTELLDDDDNDEVKSVQLTTEVNRIKSNKTLRKTFYINNEMSSEPYEKSWVTPYNNGIKNEN